MTQSLTLVVDASAIVEILLARRGASQVAEHISNDGGALHAPDLLDVEVLHSIRRQVVAGGTSAARAEEALAMLSTLRLERTGHEILLARAWSLRENFTAYDAVYLALAEILSDQGAALLTADGRFARAARTHSQVEILLVA